jgi:hypothetical protein
MRDKVAAILSLWLKPRALDLSLEIGTGTIISEVLKTDGYTAMARSINPIKAKIISLWFLYLKRWRHSIRIPLYSMHDMMLSMLSPEQGERSRP